MKAMAEIVPFLCDSLSRLKMSLSRHLAWNGGYGWTIIWHFIGWFCREPVASDCHSLMKTSGYPRPLARTVNVYQAVDNDVKIVQLRLHSIWLYGFPSSRIDALRVGAKVTPDRACTVSHLSWKQVVNGVTVDRIRRDNSWGRRFG